MMASNSDDSFFTRFLLRLLSKKLEIDFYLISEKVSLLTNRTSIINAEMLGFTLIEIEFISCGRLNFLILVFFHLHLSVNIKWMFNVLINFWFKFEI